MKQTLQTTFILLILSAALGLAQPVQAQATGHAATFSQELPEAYVLTPAYPNPFNPRTTFSLKVRERQEVTVEIYNLLGVPVRRLYSGVMDAGETRTFTFEAGDLPSGIYLYRVQAETFTVTRQVTLLK